MKMPFKWMESLGTQDQEVFAFLHKHRDRVLIGGIKYVVRATYPGERIGKNQTKEWSVAVIGNDSRVMDVVPFPTFRSNFILGQKNAAPISG